MEGNVVVVAKRENAQRSIMGALSTFGLFTVFLIFDIIFYIRDKYTWELVLLIISAILAGLALLGLLFAISNFRYAKKILNKPLISFDEDKKVFIVTDCIIHKDIEIEKDDVIEIKIGEKGESYLWHNKNSKKTSMFIGYSNKSSEDLINNELAKYKNLEC
jgi:hypothetical protein